VCSSDLIATTLVYTQPKQQSQVFVDSAGVL
jgi:hypothetical protein